MIFNHIKKLLLIMAAIILIAPVSAQAVDLTGRILLQVEDNGEAWYVYPGDGRRYFLGRPSDAFAVMRALGLGVSEADFQAMKPAPRRVWGYIVLRVEANGEAYYVDPLNGHLHFLGRPADAFRVMREQGLGATSSDIAKIKANYNLSVAPEVSDSGQAADPNAKIYSFYFRGENYQINLSMDEELYDDYRQSKKHYEYYGDLPADWREDYYGMFLQSKAADDAMARLASRLRDVAAANGIEEDRLPELALALVQDITYDAAKDLEEGTPNYPYETLFNQIGVCSDKTLLAVALFRELGYGAALFDYPEANHSAAAIACSDEYDLYDSGYCFAETTNYFPITVVPQDSAAVTGGEQSVADMGNDLSHVFSADVLGPVEIYQESKGKEYQLAEETRQLIEDIDILQDYLSEAAHNISQKKTELNQALLAVNNLKNQMDTYQQAGQVEEYNQLLPEYNQAVENYNNAYANYRLQIDIYNQKVADYNRKLKLITRVD